MTLNHADLDDILHVLTSKYDIVGASLAVSHRGEATTVAKGVLSVRTQQPVTTDSVFQVGSLTKVWTAAQIMRLVESGQLDLDAPVRTYLPEFRVVDDYVTQNVTARHLLSHSSGIDGDLFIETGRGDDALSRYVDAMAGQEQNHPLGEIFSYCNAGYTLLSQIVAVLSGATWEAAIRADLIDRLGAVHAGTFPEEALLESAAVGHQWDPISGSAVLTHQWGLFRGLAGAGLLHSTAGEQVAFAGALLRGDLVTMASSREMQTPQITVPDRTQGTAWGLGWGLDLWGDTRVLFHDGETGSQSSFLAAFPDDDLVIALCTNGGRAPVELWREISGHIAEALLGVRPPAAPTPPADAAPVDAARFAGVYRRAGFDAVVAESATGVRLTLTPRGALVGLIPDQELELVASDAPNVLLGRSGPDDTWRPVTFLSVGDQPYLHAQALAFRKV